MAPGWKLREDGAGAAQYVSLIGTVWAPPA